MNDKQIVELYLKRLESAITETKKKYGTYIRTIAMNILKSNEVPSNRKKLRCL